MAKLTYKFIDPPKDTAKALAFLRDTMIPLVREYWANQGKALYGEELSLNIITMVQLWMVGSLTIVIAYSDGKPAGFLIGVRFTPILFNANALQVEVFYAPTKEIEDGIFKYLMTIVGFMSVTEVWVRDDMGGKKSLGWPARNAFTVTRHVKE